MAMKVTVNGYAVEVGDGSSVLDAVNKSGTYIPQLCKDPARPAMGACRTCLVQVEGMRGTPASCSTPARDGMVVSTDSEEVKSIRRGVLELTMAMGDGRADNPRREVRVAADAHDLAESRWANRMTPRKDETSPFFDIEMADCIMCGRCVEACNDLQHIGAIGILGRGQDTFIGTLHDEPITESICTSCGSCVATCPTGAIEFKRGPENAQKVVKSTCPYCGVGCGINIRVGENERIIGIDDDPDNLSSKGMLCVKGRFGTGFVHHPDRLRTPLIRDENGVLQPASWDEALDLVADKLVQYRGSFASVASAKATNEDAYALQKFTRVVMGTNNVDHCTRLCHSPSVQAMLVQLGSGATSNSYEDYENAGCLLVVGADPGSNHPVITSFMRRAIDDHGAKLIVINPKRIDLCDRAHLWLRPMPGTDVALLNAIANAVVNEGLVDREFVGNRTEQFDEWWKVVESCTPEYAEPITGVPAEDIRQAARWYSSPPFSGSCLIWGMGITQHTMGTRNAHALLNLALVTGQMGRPGSGISPLRGQNNVQGCGDSGCIPDSLPGYQGVGEEAARKFGEAWGRQLPVGNGLTVTEMLEAADRGELKAMYITGENPMVTEPDLAHAREAMEKIEFLVVQELFPQETTAMADVVLPAATFAEKDGTFCNSERRVQRVRRAIQPVGESRPDWEIVCDLARRVCGKLGISDEGFQYENAGELFAEMASLTPIVSGISYERLEEGGIQWPCPSPGHPGTPRLYEDLFPIGPRAKFVPVEQGVPAAELPDDRYPIILNTGRLLYHWHAGTMTRRVEGLLEKAPEVRVAINPADAARRNIGDGEWMRVASRRGELVGRALVTEDVRAGEIFVPFVKLADVAANLLTNAVFDPESKIPEYKVCAVYIQKEEGPPGLGQAGPRDGRSVRKRRAVEV